MRKKISNEYEYINSFFSAVKVGQTINYQAATPDGVVKIPSVFLGFKINHKKTNPYAPSAITARIATTDSNRYIELVLSGDQGKELQAIFHASRFTAGNALENWNEYIKKSNVNRRTRYIYTGNLLQAFDKADSGKLISYTCKNGDTKKGILMPEHWTPKEQGNTSRSVPLKFCQRAITGLWRGDVLNTDADVSFMLQYDGNIRIITKNLSIEKFGWLVKNKKLIPLIRENGGFQKTGSSWAGSVSPRDIKQVIDIIYDEKSCNAQLSASQVKLIKDDIVRTEVKQKERYELPPDLEKIRAANPERIIVARPYSFENEQTSKTDPDKERRIRIAKAKAKAKLKILNLLKL